MDLALELGSSYETLAHSMSERELRMWMRYAAKFQLPTRRLEFYLAQVACWIARTMGGVQDAKIGDYIIVTASPEDAEEATAEEAQEFFNFNPRNRKVA